MAQGGLRQGEQVVVVVAGTLAQVVVVVAGWVVSEGV
jgi:hypothetical protein